MKRLILQKILSMMDIKLASMVYKFFDKNSKGSRIVSNNNNNNNNNSKQKQLDKELHKPIIRNFKKRTVYSEFREQYLRCWFGWYAINK